MAFCKYKSETGAWQEPENGVRRYDTDKTAWVDCESAKRYDTDAQAWKEVWGARKWLYGNTSAVNPSVKANYYTDKNSWKVSISEPNLDDIELGYFVEGSFNNPTISLEYTGGCTYRYDSDVGDRYKVGAELYIYVNRTDIGQSYEVVVNKEIGENSGEETGTYSTTLGGTYSHIGVSIVLKGFGAYDNLTFATRRLIFKNFRINGELYVPSADCIQ